MSATKDMVEFGLGGRNDFHRFALVHLADVYKNPMLETRGHGCPVCSKTNHPCSNLLRQVQEQTIEPNREPFKTRMLRTQPCFGPLGVENVVR